MLEFPSCFGENSVQVVQPFSGSASKATEKVVTSLYQTELAGISCLVTITWCKNLIGQGLSVNVDDSSCQCGCKVDMSPWFFWKKRGCKSFGIGSSKVDVFWDLSGARYESAPEPVEGFFLAVVADQKVILLLGDMCSEAYKRTEAKQCSVEARLISRREHIYGKKHYSTKAQFGNSGPIHDIVIECHLGGTREPRLCVRVDRQLVVQVKRLMWKFRGNQTIIVDGTPVELFWDVHNWLFNSNDARAVFMFQTFLSTEKSWAKVASSTSILQWQPASYCKDKEWQVPGFSLLLYAWKNE